MLGKHFFRQRRIMYGGLRFIVIRSQGGSVKNYFLRRKEEKQMNKLLFTVLAAGAAVAGYAVVKSLKGNNNDADYDDEYDDEFTISDDDIDLDIADAAEETVEEAVDTVEEAAEAVEEAAEEVSEEIED